MTQEEYVTFDTAMLLKEAGFPQEEYKNLKVYFELPLRGENGCCNRSLLHGENAITYERPTQAQAMRWLREEKLISIEMTTDENIDDWQVDVLDWNCGLVKSIHLEKDWGFTSYESAAEAGIKAACEYLIKKR